MKATYSWLAALLLVTASASSADAQFFCRSCGSQPQMAYGWGGHAPYWGPACMPNYCAPMPAQPYGGFQPPAAVGYGACDKGSGFPVHPFARSPRDFFMLDP